MLFNLRPEKQRESGEGSYIYIYIYTWYFLKTTPKMLPERSMAVSLLEETHSYGTDPRSSHRYEWTSTTVISLCHCR